jgi:hypothetical protein
MRKAITTLLSALWVVGWVSAGLATLNRSHLFKVPQPAHAWFVVIVFWLAILFAGLGLIRGAMRER